jgi:hypothetical protein
VSRDGAETVGGGLRQRQQRLSTTLQRAVPAVVPRCFANTRRIPADGEVLHVLHKVTAHMRLRLLVRPQPLVGFIGTQAKVIAVGPVDSIYVTFAVGLVAIDTYQSFGS